MSTHSNGNAAHQICRVPFGFGILTAMHVAYANDRSGGSFSSPTEERAGIFGWSATLLSRTLEASLPLCACVRSIDALITGHCWFCSSPPVVLGDDVACRKMPRSSLQRRPLVYRPFPPALSTSTIRRPPLRISAVPTLFPRASKHPHHSLSYVDSGLIQIPFFFWRRIGLLQIQCRLIFRGKKKGDREHVRKKMT